jgi:uncharacterized membrane protein YoaK (UPF0700 family)
MLTEVGQFLLALSFIVGAVVSALLLAVMTFTPRR